MMRILSVNCGSSTLKLDVLDATPGERTVTHLARGVVDRIGPDATASLSIGADKIQRDLPVHGHDDAFSAVAGLLREADALLGVEAVGHRVVHGGVRFREPALIDRAVIDAIESASELAPLHNQPALAAIKAARSQLGARIPMVASFDTTFYAELPDVAALYALPKEISKRLGIRRFGFHGLAHRYMVERFRNLRAEISEPRLITLQLGNGCSATASNAGKPVDTSMGFTPLEGLIMGTRSGDLDPSIPFFLAEQEDLSAREVESLLTTQSGLIGLSGTSGDMRDLLEAAHRGDDDADLAIRAFCYRARKCVGAYLAALGGADAIVFGGGIGEQSPAVREGVCVGLEWAGIELDLEKNRDVSQTDARISTDGSRLECWVVYVDEAAVIARDTVDCLAS